MAFLLDTTPTDVVIIEIPKPFKTLGKLSDETYSFKQRMFYPHKMHLLFQESGFTVNEKFGDWDMNPMDEESPLQIYICK